MADPNLLRIVLCRCAGYWSASLTSPKVSAAAPCVRHLGLGEARITPRHGVGQSGSRLAVCDGADEPMAAIRGYTPVVGIGPVAALGGPRLIAPQRPFN